MSLDHPIVQEETYDMILDRVFASVCLVALLASAVRSADTSGERSAAIPRAGFPGEDLTLMQALASELTAAGYRVYQLDADRLCDPNKLTPEQFDLLVLPNASPLPASATVSIESYLRKGGDIIALNAPLWQQPLLRVGSDWVANDEYQRQRSVWLPENVIYDFTEDDLAGWTRASDAMDRPTVYETVGDGPTQGQRALHSVVPNLTSWDTYTSPDLDKPFPEGHSLTVFAARGSTTTSQLAIEWVERDGSRWIAVVPLYPEWRQYILTPEQFKYWHSNPNRGGKGDRFNPANAVRFGIGLAMTHMGSIPGRHEYWVGPFGTAKTSEMYEAIIHAFEPPALDTLSPRYKFFDSTEVATLTVAGDQNLVKPDTLPVPSVIRSVHPRPSGGGFDKGRDWRWIPLLEARTADGKWRGNPAAMTIHAAGPYKGGVWASFGIGDMEWYKSPQALAIIRQVAEKMKDGVFFVDAGTQYYTYFEGQEIAPGARVVNLGENQRKGLEVKIELRNRNGDLVQSVSCEVGGHAGPVIEPLEEWKSSLASWNIGRWPDDGFVVTATLLDQGKVLDQVSHEVYAWKPKKNKEFVTVQNGEFRLAGKRWRAHGVNYMPSSGIGVEDGEYFEHWMGKRSYDPKVIQRDLEHCRDMGYNAVSIFVYHGHDKAQNLIDILRRLDQLGMKANLSLRPGTPMDFPWDKVKDMIEYSRLAENDTVFAYDLAWEPMFNTHNDRKVWDGEWEKWIIERYGSIENAEKDWKCAVPRDESGKVTNPLPHQIDTKGEWNAMVAAYRRFLDTLLYKKYGEARRLVRSIDPNHLVSFRMAEAGNPNYRWDGRIPYDFPYLAAAVDFLAPEAYGRIGDTWDKVKPGWFEREYARWAAPRKPMIWAEQGVSTWDTGRMMNTVQKLEFQARFYSIWYEMLIKSGADGLFSWWYPGGFRVGENSDYGVINPDGSDREVTRVIRENARKFVDGPSMKPVDVWLEFDRDEHPDGIAGVYDELQSEFWTAIEKGLTPGLRTSGTGTTSADCPLVAVGNTPCNGSNPPKYLDGAFDVVEVRDASGKWVPVEKGGTVKVAAKTRVVARVQITNLGEASWVSGKGTGAVAITVEGAEKLRTALTRSVAHQDSTGSVEVTLSSAGVTSPTPVVLSLIAEGRTPFGEKFGLVLDPSR